MKKPVFYEAKLGLVEGNVLDHVYPHLKGDKQLTMAERMGSEEAKCPDCDNNEWWLYPRESTMVLQGGKPYCECLHCGFTTHL